MSQIILDMGSGNSNPTYGDGIDAINAVKEIDSHKHEVIFKYQLWSEDNPQGENRWLTWRIFMNLRDYAVTMGYKVTSSVFDYAALQYLLTFDKEKHRLPFIKLANRPDTWYLLGDIPRRIPVYISNYLYSCGFRESGIVTSMACVSKYPASLKEYEMIPNLHHYQAISDHTVGLELWDKYHPPVWEKHFVLTHNDTNPDAGPFAITPEELKEVIG